MDTTEAVAGEKILALKRAFDAVCSERNIRKGSAEAELLAERAIALYRRGGLDERQLHTKLRQDA
jgi:hypothetical protein